jgi:hypothetical protein
MKKIFLFTTLLSLSSCLISASDNSQISANKPQHFPFLTGADLNGKKYNLPTELTGKFNLVAIGFEREHQSAIDTWIPALSEVIKTYPDLNIKFYEIPLIYELGTFSRVWVNNGMRFGIRDQEARNRTITVFTNRDKFYDIMKMEGDRIYLVLLSDEGKILWRTDGEMTSEKLILLKRILGSFKNINPEIKKDLKENSLN